jgi:signal transduction histidine kinase
METPSTQELVDRDGAPAFWRRVADLARACMQPNPPRNWLDQVTSLLRTTPSVAEVWLLLSAVADDEQTLRVVGGPASAVGGAIREPTLVDDIRAIRTPQPVAPSMMDAVRGLVEQPAPDHLAQAIAVPLTWRENVVGWLMVEAHSDVPADETLLSRCEIVGCMTTVYLEQAMDWRERMQLEQRLNQTHEGLEQAERQALVAEIAGTAAHELNQPLTSILGYAELLKRKLPAESLEAHCVSTILAEADRMAEIVRKIGNITRYRTKSYVGQQKIIDLEQSTRSDSEPPTE